MNVPNKLTLFRVILIPVFMFFYLGGDGSTAMKYAALAVFVVAAWTDRLDGHLARKNNQITTFGKLMDPMADKMLILAAMICFVQAEVPYVNAAVVMIVLARELVVSGIRMIAMGEKTVIAASIWGKAKTVSQFIMTIGIMVFDIAQIYLPQLSVYFNPLILIMVTAAVILTVFSGLDYCIKNRSLIKFK